MQKQKQVLVVDDHPMVLNVLKELVEGLFFDVTAVATADETLQALEAKHFDLILLDMKLPDMDGKSLLNLILANHKESSVLIVSGTLETQEVTWALDKRAKGYIDKRAPTEELEDAIIKVINGGRYIPYKIQSAVKDIADNQEAVRVYLKITVRQYEVLKLLAKGLPNKVIAEELHISKETVGTHLKALFRILNVKTRTACVNSAKKLGLI